jgi:methionyl-tRNA formyltransferase
VKTVFLGTSGFAADVLRHLAASEHRPTLVVTPPDRPRGRGRHVQAPPAAVAARELDLELLQTADVNEIGVLERISAKSAGAAAVCAFGQLIREPLLSELLLLNVHPSLLPRWRGAAPIERAIMAGDEATGVSVMRVAAGLDAGPVALREQVGIAPGDDYATLSERLMRLAGPLLVRALDLQARDELSFEEQDEGQATYAEKIAAAERRLDPQRPAVELGRTVRALTPHIGAYLELSGHRRLGVRRAVPVHAGLAAGELRAEGGELLLGCHPGTLRLELVQPEGGRPMEVEAYLRGHPLPVL